MRVPVLAKTETIAMAVSIGAWVGVRAQALEQLMRGATRVTLGVGEKKPVDLRLPAGRRP